MKFTACYGLLLIVLMTSQNTKAQNPIIRNQYSADPTAREFNGKVYLYPSHDIIAKEGMGKVGWFCMEDYHVFSSVDLNNWQDHGKVITQNTVPWVRRDSYSMWAPDCVERNGKYYFYFPSVPADTIQFGKGFTVGVAVSTNPEGPFIPNESPIAGVHGVDPNVLIDDDGSAYLYWSAGNIYAAKLKPDMIELESAVTKLENLPGKGLKEGPFVFKRKGIYYLTYPHVEDKIERLEYAIGDNPFGPFKVMGTIMDESLSGCWTNHQSIMQFKNQWYLFYHNDDYSPNFDKARSVRVDSLSFNEDGTISKVIPTLRGVGLGKPNEEIQLDRFSAISPSGLSISFLDSSNKFLGWKSVFNDRKAWLTYNSIDFGKANFKEVMVRGFSDKGGELTLHEGNEQGPIVATITIHTTETFQLQQAKIKRKMKGIQNITATWDGEGPGEIDWIMFK